MIDTDIHHESQHHRIIERKILDLKVPCMNYTITDEDVNMAWINIKITIENSSDIFNASVLLRSNSMFQAIVLSLVDTMHEEKLRYINIFYNK